MKNNRWFIFKYNTWPSIKWYLSGEFIWDEMYSFWWLNVARRKPLWYEADPNSCNKWFCNYCGKGTI